MTRLGRRSFFSLVAVAGVLACRADAAAPPLGNAGVLSVAPVAAIDTADGVRLDTIVANVDVGFKSQNTPVKFATTAGVFSTGAATYDATPDSTGTARAFLRAPTEAMEATITASAGGGSKKAKVTFVAAHPAWLQLVAAPSVIAAAQQGAFADVTLTLVRTKGTTTPGSTVLFDVAGALRSAIRLSVDSVFMTTNTAATRATLQSPDVGSAYVRATYRRDGTIIRDSVLIRFFKPST
jgi:hypothetical protein